MTYIKKAKQNVNHKIITKTIKFMEQNNRPKIICHMVKIQCYCVYSTSLVL